MRESMVRTQVYLPRRVYDKLQTRAGKQGLTLAVQVRAALEDYLERVEFEADDGVLHPDDPIFQMIGMIDRGPEDLSVNHDHYLYGAPKREPVRTMKEKSKRKYRTTTRGKRKTR